jgi:hypothetical protein
VQGAASDGRVHAGCPVSRDPVLQSCPGFRVSVLEDRVPRQHLWRHVLTASPTFAPLQVQATQMLQDAPLSVGGSLAPTDCGPFGGDCGSGWKI